MVPHFRLNRDRLARFFGYVEFTPTCWNWRGCVNGKGYAHFGGGAAYRLAYSWFVGPIPIGLQIDHLCANILCVNPIHLEAVTERENRRRAVERRTACRHGHPRSLFWNRPHSQCRECHRLSQTAYYRRVTQGIQAVTKRHAGAAQPPSQPSNLERPEHDHITER
jgi:hypothetical protein